MFRHGLIIGDILRRYNLHQCSLGCRWIFGMPYNLTGLIVAPGFDTYRSPSWNYQRLPRNHHRNPSTRDVHYFRSHNINVSSQTLIPANGRMGNLVGFEGFLNDSTPFSLDEHKATWRGERQYSDFKWNNEYNNSCELPRFWGEDGFPVEVKGNGCYNRYNTLARSNLMPVISTNMATLRHLVYSLTGNANCPNSRPSKTVFANGNQVWVTKSNISPV